MNDRSVFDPIPGLDGELAALDAELGALRIAERASFAPELHAELARSRKAGRDWIVPASPARWALVAASLAAILFAVAAPPAAVSSITVLMERLDAVMPAPSARVQVERWADPAPVPEVPAPTLSTVGVVEAIDPFKPVRMVRPRALDLGELQATIRRLYPQRLQRAGIGGIVNVQVHVDTAGSVIESLVFQGSGITDLDRAAMAAVPGMRFQPATWDGRPFSTWVQFDIVFEPSVNDLPVGIDSGERRNGVGPGAIELLGGASPIMQETLGLLQAALGDSVLAQRLGGIDGLVHGEPPRGADPFEWRESAVRALEGALRRAPENPAPFLALARIRRKQGLPDEARALLLEGIGKAERGGFTVSPRLTADLQYELAGAARESWRSWDHLGRVPAEALRAGACARARTGAQVGEATPETLIAWNFVCPDELRRVLDAGFEEVSGPDDHGRMVRSLQAAVTLDPGNVLANVDLLLDMAENDDVAGLLNGARRFSFESHQHPYARLLMGIALEAMGRLDEANAQLQAGLSGLPTEEAERIRDIRPLLEPDAAQRLGSLAPGVRAQAETEFWVAQDPLRSTAVNERLVSHLARSAYAYLRLGGSQTDAGGVWVRYGEPVRIRAVGAGTALRTELWDYGTGPAVVFRRAASSSALELTPESRAYLLDLRTTRPREYGGSSVAVEPIFPEVSRFRDAQGAIEVEFAALVPESLRSGKEAVEATLFQLDARGREISTHAAELRSNGTVRGRIPIDPATREIALEVWSPAQGRAATAHVALGGRLEHATTGAGGSVSAAPSVSDLQLVRPGNWAKRESARRPDLFETLPTHRIQGPDLGLLFELYDLPDSKPYSLKVWLQPSSGGPPRPLEFRPSGESRWSTGLERTPARADRTAEYVLVRMSDVPAGTYALRVVATLNDGSALVLRREIERK